MKRFLVNIITVLFSATVILVAVTLIDVNRIHSSNFSIGENYHIIALGPSTTGYSITNDIPGLKNVSREATYFNEIMPLLPKILDDNPQIDTVLINHGRFQFKHMKGNGINTNFQGLRTDMPLLLYNLKHTKWKDLLINLDFYGAMLNPDAYNFLVFDRSRLEGYGFLGYCYSEYEHLFNETAPWSVYWYDSKMKEHGSNYYSKEWIYENCKETHDMISYGISVCQSREVTPVLLFTPLYQYDRWCSRRGFCDYMKDLDPDLLIADYEDFQFPNESYYQDVHHLNHKGAEFFTSYIATHGLKTVRLEDWLTEKSTLSVQ